MIGLRSCLRSFAAGIGWIVVAGHRWEYLGSGWSWFGWVLGLLWLWLIGYRMRAPIWMIRDRNRIVYGWRWRIWLFWLWRWTGMLLTQSVGIFGKQLYPSASSNLWNCLYCCWDLWLSRKWANCYISCSSEMESRNTRDCRLDICHSWQPHILHCQNVHPTDLPTNDEWEHTNT